MVETVNTGFSPQETWEAKREVELKYNQQILACEKCSQRGMCETPVTGTGAIHGRMLLVGDYPDDKIGKPFSAEAWDLLTMLLSDVGAIEWDQDEQIVNHGVYFTTAVKCGTKGRHKPRATEMRACRPWLGAQLGTMGRGTVVVALGNLAVASLTGKPLAKCKVSFGHGIFEELHGRLFMPTFHPNYVIRRGQAEWGYTRNQLRTDLDTAWRAANRVFQPKTP
jgi:uracil-DNA glycosylase